jgi:hypothetical protein
MKESLLALRIMEVDFWSVPKDLGLIVIVFLIKIRIKDFFWRQKIRIETIRQ